MAEGPDPVAAEQPREARVESARGISIVWLIPLIALIAGGWVAYKAWSAKGPTITIRFERGSGIEAGKTKVRYKDVEIGIVSTVGLSDDLRHVIITAELQKGTAGLLTTRTRFWVATARVTASRVSGLGTLFSGAYIGIDPVLDGKPARDFIGLESEPVVPSSDPGSHFVLRAPGLGSLNPGSPVYFRQINVGQVVDYQLAEDGRSVDIRIFVPAPHDERVRSNTRFWNASGLDLKLEADGITLQTESLVSILIGGIAFDTPRNLESNERAPPDTVFALYPNRQAVDEIRYARRNTYLLLFDGTVRGLTVGSPVEFRGIKIGEVTDFRLEFDATESEFHIPVLIDIEPGRITVVEGTAEGDEQTVARLVSKGLRAQLRSGNVLTGQLLVNLDIFPDAPPSELRNERGYTVLPTIPSTTQEVISRLQNLLVRLEQLPLERIVRNVEQVTDGANRLVNDPGINRDLREITSGANTLINDPTQRLQELLAQLLHLVRGLDIEVRPQIESTLLKAQTALDNTTAVTASDSGMHKDIRRALRDISDAARSVRSLTEYLERHPEALLRGKSER